MFTFFSSYLKSILMVDFDVGILHEFYLILNVVLAHSSLVEFLFPCYHGLLLLSHLLRFPSITASHP